VVLGEIRETIGLLKSPIRGFRKLTREYHKRAKRLAKTKTTKRNLKKRLGEEWLRYSFGVKPLLQDIDDAMHDLAYLLEGRPPVQPILVERSDSTLQYTYDGAATSISFWTSTLNAYDRVRESVIIRGMVRVDIPKIGSAYQGDAAITQAMSEFVPTLWELIPFSFIVDYFTNVGDFISAITFLENSVIWCNCTRRLITTQVKNFSYRFETPGSAYRVDSVQTNNPESAVESTKFRRDKVESFIPVLHTDFGSLEKWRRMTNLTALLASCRSAYN